MKKKIKESKEKNITLKVIGLVGIIILAFVSLIGIFWGTDGIRNTFVGIGTTTVFIVIMLFVIQD